MRLRHVLSTDNALGDLVFIDVGSTGTATTTLELGQNIQEGSWLRTRLQGGDVQLCRQRPACRQ